MVWNFLRCRMIDEIQFMAEKVYQKIDVETIFSRDPALGSLCDLGRKKPGLISPFSAGPVPLYATLIWAYNLMSLQEWGKNYVSDWVLRNGEKCS